MSESDASRIIKIHNENKSLFEKVRNVNSEIRKEVFDLFYEITEGEKITFSRTYTLKKDGLYKYKTTKRISREIFFNYSDGEKHEDIFDKENLNPFHELRKKIPEHLINEEDRENLERLFQMIENYNKELSNILCVSPHEEDFNIRKGMENRYIIGNSMRGYRYIDGYCTFVRNTNGGYLLHVPKLIRMDSPPIMFFNDIKIKDNDEVYLKKKKLDFCVKEEAFKNEDRLSGVESYQKDIMSLFMQTNRDLNRILSINEEVLGFINSNFARARVAKKI